jgi:hypothetical protein
MKQEEFRRKRLASLFEALERSPVPHRRGLLQVRDRCSSRRIKKVRYFLQFFLLYIFRLSFYGFISRLSEFEDLPRSLPASEFAAQRRDFTAKASIFGKIACERLIAQEKANKKLLEDHQKLNRNFKLSRAANSDLEKKVSELADALKKCQDEKKIAEEAAENSRKELERLRKTHDDDLRMIENLRKDHDKSLKTTKDLHANNSDLAKSLSVKDRRIQDLERALTE